MSQAAQATVTEVLKAAPAVGVALTGVTGAVDWPTVSYILVSLYTLLQIILLIPKYREAWRKGV